MVFRAASFRVGLDLLLLPGDSYVRTVVCWLGVLVGASRATVEHQRVADVCVDQRNEDDELEHSCVVDRDSRRATYGRTPVGGRAGIRRCRAAGYGAGGGIDRRPGDVSDANVRYQQT